MAFDLTQSNVDADVPDFQPMLKDLQANILKGHGRSFGHFIFLRLHGSAIGAARQWIARFATERVTSAFELESGRRAFKLTGADGGAVFTLSISAAGYATLGFQPDQFPKEMETPANSIVKDAPGFPGGAKGSAEKLGDDVKGNWEKAFQGEVHVLVLVADNQAGKARQLAESIIQEVQAFSDVLLNQKGHVLHRQTGTSGRIGIEHFGYADGVSQPLYFKDEIEAQENKQWSDQEPLNLALVPDPNGQDNNSFGSFLVFRKLEQDVAGFMKAEETAIAPIRDSDGIVNPDLSGAMMVGRFRNGNPLMTSGGFTGDIRSESQITNDFDYSNDPPPAISDHTMYSSKCPFFAHTRITNPRADIKITPPITPQFIHSVRLTRRAMPYQDVCRFGEGKENQLTFNDQELRQDPPKAGAGLLFMSYQAHIGKQFEFIQNNWANHGHIAGRSIGEDGVIGQNSGPLKTGLPAKPPDPDRQPRRLPEEWGRDVAPDGPVIPFGDFVRNKGGEYFFTPSISFLRRLTVS